MKHQRPRLVRVDHVELQQFFLHDVVNVREEILGCVPEPISHRGTGQRNDLRLELAFQPVQRNGLSELFVHDIGQKRSGAVTGRHEGGRGLSSVKHRLCGGKIVILLFFRSASRAFDDFFTVFRQLVLRRGHGQLIPRVLSADVFHFRSALLTDLVGGYIHDIPRHARKDFLMSPLRAFGMLPDRNGFRLRSGVLKQVNLLTDGKNIFRFLTLLPEQLILQLVQLGLYGKQIFL